MLAHFILGLIFLSFPCSIMCSAGLATYVVKPDRSDVMSVALNADSQLTPIYNHGGPRFAKTEDKTDKHIRGGSDGRSSVIVTMTSIPSFARAVPSYKQDLSRPKSKRRTSNAPTGLAKLLQEALLKHSKPSKKKQERPLPHIVKKVNLRKAPILQPSIYVPEEVIVSAGQQLPSFSVLGPFNTDINNDLNNNPRYDYAISEPRPSANANYALVDIGNNKRTGLVTTMGGTIVANGKTIIHKTSVIGTYIDGQYAQILKSTSMIFNASPVRNNLLSPTPRPTYETIRAVTGGSITKFIVPAKSSLFTITPDRKPRYEQNYPSLIKRQGSNKNEREYFYADDNTQRDSFYDEYDEFPRFGSAPRPSFKSPNIYRSTIAPTKSFVRPQPSTFRHRYKSGSTRNTPPSFLRNSPPPLNFNRDRDRFRLSTNRFTSKPTTTTSNNNKKKLNRRPALKNRIVTRVKQHSEPINLNIKLKQNIEETVRVVTSRPAAGPSDIFYEIIILKSLHTYRLGANKNTRYLTYTRTSTHTIEPTTQLLVASTNPTIYENPPLFENILDNPKEISTLPPITINGQDLSTLLQKTTETITNMETMYKTSVLPVQQNSQLYYHTLIQTYYITRVVTAVKTIPPYQRFNEYNGPLAVGETENILSLQPEEREYDENGAIRERFISDFDNTDRTLEELVGAKFNPEAFLERQQHQSPIPKLNQDLPQLHPGTRAETQNFLPTATATPALTPEALQMYYLRLMMGGIPNQSKPTVLSSAVFITTNVITTETNVLVVTLNARRIQTTISSTFLKSTVLTSYITSTVAAAPSSPFFGGLPFPAAPIPFHGG